MQPHVTLYRASHCIKIIPSNYHTPVKRMFSGVYWNQPVCPSVYVSARVSVCVQNTTFCQSAGRGIKSHLVTALILFTN